MGTPNVEGTSNPAALAGGVFGAIVGEADGAVGFFGSAGATQGSAASMTTLAALVAYLQSLGLLGA